MKQASILLFILISSLPIKTTAQLNSGQQAPVFSVNDVNDNLITLTQLKGKKVWIAFFRYAGCPVCHFRVHELIDHYQAIRNSGYELIAVFESSNETLQTYMTDEEIPFIVIGDPNLILYKKYQVEKSMSKMMKSAFSKKTKQNMKNGDELFHNKKYKRDGSLTRIPADFIIDESGIIEVAYYGRSISDHYPLSNLTPN